MIAHLFKVSDKFVTFLETYLPAAPEPRPTMCGLSWPDLHEEFITIYGRRSEALHEGVPIPWPMTMPPRETENGALEEYSPGLGSWSGGGYWSAQATPMYLNTFAYIVRGALMKWWQSMVPADGKTEEAGPEQAQ
jgi:hypothetical protein